MWGQRLGQSEKRDIKEELLKRNCKLSFALMVVFVSTVMAFALTGCGILQNENYTPKMGKAELNSPTIGQEGTLRVGVDATNSPLAGSSDDKIIGIDVDLAGALGDELGLAVEVKDVGSDAKSAIENGDVDIVLGIDSDTSESGMWISSEYIPTGIALFALESSGKDAPKTSDNVKVGTQISSKSAWAIANSFGDDALVSESDLASAFLALETGEVDYVASDAIVGLYAANKQDVDIELVGIMGATSGYCAMAKKDNPDLTSVISETLSGIVDDGVMDVIEQKWLVHSVDLSGLSKIDLKSSSDKE